MNRIYHPYWLWEDYKNGMWRTVPASEHDKFLDEAIRFTGDHIIYGSFMKRVVIEWLNTCEHNLTDLTQNRRAFVGHCACCLAINCPEYITREAWGYLSKVQQDLANEQADKAIELWEHDHGIGGNKIAQIIFEF